MVTFLSRNHRCAIHNQCMDTRVRKQCFSYVYNSRVKRGYSTLSKWIAQLWTTRVQLVPL